MTGRELKQKIRKVYTPPGPKRREEFLYQISSWDKEGEIFMTARLGRKDFFLSQLGYIRKWVWMLSVLLFSMAVLVAWVMPYTNQSQQYYVTDSGVWEIDGDAGRAKSVPDYETLLWSMSAVLPLLSVIFIAEGSRSFRYGMQELEMAAKYNRMQIYLARMLFLGLGNLLWIIAADVVLHWVGSGAADFVIVYLLVPYLLSMVLSMELGRICPRSSMGVCSTAVACAVSVGYIILKVKVDIYLDQYRLYWAALCILLLYRSVKQFAGMEKTWEEQLCSLQ